MKDNPTIINITDLPSDIPGKSWRQKNSEMKHKYKIGALVEIDSGIRMFICRHTRDCDKTPLYVLSDSNDTWQWENNFCAYSGGFSENGMKLIKEPDLEIDYPENPKLQRMTHRGIINE